MSKKKLPSLDSKQSYWLEHLWYRNDDRPQILARARLMRKSMALSVAVYGSGLLMMGVVDLANHGSHFLGALVWEALVYLFCIALALVDIPKSNAMYQTLVNVPLEGEARILLYKAYSVGVLITSLVAVLSFWPRGEDGGGMHLSVLGGLIGFFGSMAALLLIPIYRRFTKADAD